MINISRIARKYYDTSFFHVIVQGINKEYIFKKDRYINKYLQLLNEKIYKEEIKIVAYCIMNNHAHLLIKVDDIKNLSIYMQKVNTVYAKYYNYMEKNRVGYVFRDRFKSEPILNRRQLIQCIKYIHRNPVKANMVQNEEEYQYSSYSNYKVGKINKLKIFTNEEIQYICNTNIINEDLFLDIETDEKKDINDLISEFVINERIKAFEIFENDEVIKKLIKFLKQQKKIRYTEMMKSLDITKGTMERLKK